jgi:nitrite reductase/ring-hydroxylating ferredoxin subunit
MEFIERFLGISRTRKPKDESCWKFFKGKIEVDWARAPELRKPCGAIQLQDRGLPERILIFYGFDGQFHAFKNKCTYMYKRLVPVPGKAIIRCRCLYRSTFDYNGDVLSGPAKQSLKKYPVESKKCKMIIRLY